MFKSFPFNLVWIAFWIVLFIAEIVGSLGNIWSLITIYFSGTRLKHFKLYFNIVFCTDLILGIIIGFNTVFEYNEYILWNGLENINVLSCKIMRCVSLVVCYSNDSFVY